MSERARETAGEATYRVGVNKLGEAFVVGPEGYRAEIQSRTDAAILAADLNAAYWLGYARGKAEAVTEREAR